MPVLRSLRANGKEITLTLPTAPVQASSYTMTQSASSGITGSADVLTFTPVGGVWGTVTIPISVTGVANALSNGSGGTLSGSALTPPAGTTTACTILMTPSAVGTATIAATNSGVMTNPGSLTYSVSSPVVPTNTANRYDILANASAGDTSTAQTIRIIPNGAWNGGNLTLTANKTGGGTSAVGTLTLPASGNTTQTITWTPPSTGEWKITGTNTASMLNPYGAPFNCFSAAAGTAQTLTVGSNFLDQQPFQQDVWGGTPNYWSAINGATFGMGWGEFWAQITPGGSSAGVFARLVDSDSSGATSTGGGTIISNAAQVYGAVTGGSQVTIRILVPSSDYTPYIELATDSAFTNPARIPLRFRITDVVAILSRSMEVGWMQCYPYAGPPGNTNYCTYTKTMFCGCQNPGGSAMSVWGRADGVHSTDYFASWGSVGAQEAGRMWMQHKGHGCALVGVAEAGGNTDDFLQLDGTPYGGFSDAVSKCNYKFRYLKTLMNGWSGYNSTPESYSEYQTIYGNFVSKMTTNYPALAVMAIGISSGEFGGDGSNSIGYVRVNKIITDQIEPSNPMVSSADAAPDWDEWTSGHATWPSQMRYVRAGVRAMLMADGVHAGGYGLSRADRYATFSSTGTVSGDNLFLPFTLPSGAGNLVAKQWANGMTTGTFVYTTPTANQLRVLFSVYAGAAGAWPSAIIHLTGITIDNVNKRLVLALDRSAGAGTVKYGDGSSGAQPAQFTVQVFSDFNRDLNDISVGVGIFDDRALDDCGYGPHARPQLDIVCS